MTEPRTAFEILRDLSGEYPEILDRASAIAQLEEPEREERAQECLEKLWSVL